MKTKIAVLQNYIHKDFYDNLETIQTFIDMLGDKKVDMLVLQGNFAGKSLSKDQLEEVLESLSALSEFNNLLIVGSYHSGTKTETIIQIPYKEPVLLKNASKEFELNKEMKVNIIHPSEGFEKLLINDEKIINVVSSPSIDKKLNAENYVCACPAETGMTQIKVKDKIYTGGNCEGYLIAEL